MNAPDRVPDWTEANQRLLVAEFARLKARLGGGDAEVAAGVDAPQETLDRPSTIETLAGLFGLSAFERDVVLLAAGVEMDSRLASLCGDALGQAHRPWLTFGLALSALDAPHWSALAPDQPLRYWRLVELDDGPLTSARLRIDERVLHFVAGVDTFDPRLAAIVRPVADASWIADSHAAVADRLVAAWRADPLSLLQLHGDDPQGREDAVASAAASLGWRLQALDIAAWPMQIGEADPLVRAWERESRLGIHALFVECGSDAPSPSLRHFLERVGGPVVIGSDAPLAFQRPVQRHRVGRLSSGERRVLWQRRLGDAYPDAFDADLDTVASRFEWPARRIAETAATLQGRDPSGAVLVRACREQAPAQLGELGRRIDARADWDDLILPAMQKRTLEQIVVHVRRSFEVHERWGFAAGTARGSGVAALFTGQSGTGKTMAAEVIAGRLALDLCRVDLSSVVSKYIGETEKNLRRVFDAAEESAAVLLFDEADALFGKRSEVKDSHDRYANIEVSYLLQRMESYRGLAILTTNHRSALDSAFARRLRFVVHFPFPEAAEREAIWRRVFPSGAPLGALAWDKLARLQVAGGHIRNIALGAAFFAAEAGEPIGMVHVLKAACADAAKDERSISEHEMRGWT